MRRILAASVLTLLPSLILPAAAKASTPVDDATATTPVRISTGVIAPVVVGSPVLSLPEGLSFDLIPPSAQVQVSLTVNEKGQPENVRVVKSFSPFVDARVIDTVNQLHFRPGTVDNQPTAVDVNLTVNVTR
jgi:TonB family protein